MYVRAPSRVLYVCMIMSHKGLVRYGNNHYGTLYDEASHLEFVFAAWVDRRF